MNESAVNERSMDELNPALRAEENGERPVFLQPATGILTEADHTVTFQMKAIPNARVEALVGNDFHNRSSVSLREEKRGLYRAKQSFPELAGPQNITFLVNNQEVLNTAGPMWYHANSLCNYVELPDPETDELLKKDPNIPHGKVIHEFYWSQAMQEFCSSIVYVPPGYAPSKTYPVVYFLHEVAENETAWTDASGMNFLFDNMISKNLCEPFLLVENDCTVYLDYHDHPDWFENYPPLENFLTKDCLNFIEKNYSVRSDAAGRAMTGIGLGAVQAGYVGLRNPQLYGNIGLFTAFWPSLDFHDQGKQDPFYDAAEKIVKCPDLNRIFFRSEGESDGHFSGVLKENAMLSRIGIDSLPGYVYKTYPGSHEWGTYRRAFRDFLPLLSE